MRIRRAIPPACALAGAGLLVAAYVRGVEPSHLGVAGLLLLLGGLAFMPASSPRSGGRS